MLIVKRTNSYDIVVCLDRMEMPSFADTVGDDVSE